jgi:Ca2+-binding RTX toxin-like protein
MTATVLNPGDIAIVGYITNGSPDSFSFVPLVDLSAGTEIYFTDSGWISNEFRDTEGIIKFTANSDIAAGTVINSTDELNDFTWVNFSGSFNLSGTGDQIAALQSNNLENPLSSDFTAIYQIDNTGAFEDTDTSSSGNVITGLSEGENTAVLFDDTAKYAAFDFNAIPNGTREDWLEEIKNPENWTFSNDETALTLPPGGIEVISEIENAAPIIGNNVLLYDGGTGKSPEEAESAPNAPWLDYQGTTFELNNIPIQLGGIATQTVVQDGVTLKTDDTAYAGYTNHEVVLGLEPQLNPRDNFPTLDRNDGYVVSFTNQIISENHNTLTADKNGDGLADRAGFSVIAISEDKKGIELGFWENRIWAQEDGIEEPTSNSEGTLFTQAEGVDFDTTTFVKYDLSVKGDRYTLFADGNAILEGELRDYTAFEPAESQIATTFGTVPVTPPDPYEKSSFLFFGDNTPTASAEVKLSDISVTTNSDKPSFFKVDENAVRGTFVGKVSALDPDSTTLSNWQIIDGNLDVDGDGKDAFAINSNTGNIIVNDADDLDFETNSSFQLQVNVSDGINTSNPGIVTINLNDVGGSQIDGTSENDRLKGSPEDDIIDGKAGNDFLYGYAGNDTLTGGSGNDNLYGGEGDDSINGGEGIDTLRETADTNFTLTDAELQSNLTGTDTFTNIERVALTGGDGANTINASAFSGTAFLYGKGGNDSLTGGKDNDNLSGGEGDDSIDGGEGIDTLRETADTNFTLTINTLSSTATGTDSFTNIERVALTGGDSANTINASAFSGRVILNGKGGNDTLTGGKDNDNLSGGEGDDSIDGGEGIDTLRETADTDFSFNANNQLQSNLTGTDTFTNIERVALTGGDSANTIDASGFSGTAFLYGKGGNDTLTGGSGNDVIKGGEGDDLINGDAGNDRLYGEGGNDTFVLSLDMGKDTIYDFEDGFDKLGLSDSLTFENLTITASGSNTNILQGNQTLAILINIDSSLINQSDFTPLA